MIVSIQACFDVGKSFALDDSPFAPLTATDRTTESTFPPIQYPAPPHPDTYYGVPLGNGFRVTLPVPVKSLVEPQLPQNHSGWGNLVAQWQEKAAAYESTAAHKDGRKSNEELISLIQDRTPSRCFYEVYAIGIVFLRLDFDDFPEDDRTLSLLEAFYECYQYAALYESMTRRLKRVVNDILDTLRLDSDPFVILTGRKIPPARRDFTGELLSHEIRYFDCVAVLASDRLEQVSKALGEINGGPLRRIKFKDHGTLYFGMEAKLVHLEVNRYERQREVLQSQDATDRYHDRILYALQLASVFSATVETFEEMFASKVRNLVRGDGTGLSARDAGRLRLLALSIVELTTFELVTFGADELTLFRVFEASSQLRSRRQRIRQVSSLFHAVYQEEERERREEEDERTERRGQRLSLLLAILSVLAFGSVVADMVGGVDFEKWNTGRYWWRILVISSVVCLVGALLCWGYLRHGVSSSRDADDISGR